MSPSPSRAGMDVLVGDMRLSWLLLLDGENAKLAAPGARPKRQHPHSGRRRGMKFNLEIDRTPEEARSMLGLPDLEPLHETYLKLARAPRRETRCRYDEISVGAVL